MDFRDQSRLHDHFEYLLVFLLLGGGATRPYVLAGVIVMGIVAAAAKKNEELHRVELIGLYWHFVDIVWIFLFPLLYIAK